MSSLRGLHLHLDPVSGIAGDMTVAALVDAGVPGGVVSEAIASMGVKGLSVRFEARRQGAFVGKSFVVDFPGAASRPRERLNLSEAAGRAHGDGEDHDHSHAHSHGHDHQHDHDHAPVQRKRTRRRRSQLGAPPPNEGSHHHRDYAQIRGLLKAAKLDLDAKALAEEIFARLAEVEAALHGTSVARVTFHEVGAFDSIADIVGMSAAIAWLAPAAIGSSAPVVGTGFVQTAHGVVPVPAPATLALLRGIPMLSEGQGELTTPTGAAFLASAVDSFGPPPPLQVLAVGYGAGTKVLADRPNVLRVMLGTPIGASLAAPAQDVLVVETNIDDMSGQLLAALFEALFKAGALDVWSTPILMKKGRPAQKMSALVTPELLPVIERAFFLESTTIGLRVFPVGRSTLARSALQVATPFGAISVKVSAMDGQAVSATPEYEDCRRRAASAGVPVRRVWAAALGAATALTVASNGAPALNGAPAPKKPRPGAKRGRR